MEGRLKRREARKLEGRKDGKLKSWKVERLEERVKSGMNVERKER